MWFPEIMNPRKIPGALSKRFPHGGRSRLASILARIDTQHRNIESGSETP
jgi:hypothetical protein